MYVDSGLLKIYPWRKHVMSGVLLCLNYRMRVSWLDGIDVNIRRVLLARPLTPMPGQEKLVAVLQRQAREVLGFDIPVNGVPFFTDARFYAAAGIPTVLYGAGPRDLFDARGHAADEHLVLNDLRAATKIVALTLADLLSS